MRTADLDGSGAVAKIDEELDRNARKVEDYVDGPDEAEMVGCSELQEIIRLRRAVQESTDDGDVLDVESELAGAVEDW